MDLSIAKSRMDSVIRTDSITASQGDFLATHVPLRRLQLLHKFDLQPTQGQTSTEESSTFNMFAIRETSINS